MLVLCVVAILGSVTLYFGKAAVDKAKMFSEDIKAEMFIMKLFDYHDATGEWPIAAENFVSVAEMELELNKAFDNVFGVDGNPYSLRTRIGKKFRTYGFVSLGDSIAGAKML